jgi:uncharacterized protein YfiM (DUF2279 family)
MQSQLSSQTIAWRWADDTSELTMDKEAHFVGSAGAYFFFRHKGYNELASIRNAFYLGMLKEIADALLPLEKYGRWGGDGFSKYDLYYDVAGIAVGYLIDKLWKPKLTVMPLTRDRLYGTVQIKKPS